MEKAVLNVIDPFNQFTHTTKLDSMTSIYRGFSIFFTHNVLEDSVQRIRFMCQLAHVKKEIEKEVDCNMLCARIILNHSAIQICVGKMKHVTHFLLKREIE
jgi:hypothetical protein